MKMNRCNAEPLATLCEGQGSQVQKLEPILEEKYLQKVPETTKHSATFNSNLENPFSEKNNQHAVTEYKD